jgi:hypothetical protein
MKGEPFSLILSNIVADMLEILIAGEKEDVMVA